MFDDVPVQVWLVIAIAAAAYAPAGYVYRHIAQDPSRREITAPREDLSWRSTRQLVISASMLATLAALVIFIFTPAAERFARSPSFVPLLLFALGAIALFTVAKSLATGTIEPLVRGFSLSYERSTQPKRFWASAVWNALLGGVFMAGAIASISSQRHDRCDDYADTIAPRERLAACDESLAEPDLSRADRNDLFRARGTARHELGDHEQAIDDYNRAIDLDPNDSYALYNRGLLYLNGEQFRFAIEDFSRSLRVRPDNKDGYVNRAEAYAATGNIPMAIADCTRVLAVDPYHEKTLLIRGMLYVAQDEIGRAGQDFARIRARDPSSVGLLRGEAFLSVHTKDLETARRKLREALDREPEDQWTLAMLAEVHDRLGQPAEAQAIRDRLVPLVRRHLRQRD